MTQTEWRIFLERYSSELLKSDDLHLGVEISDDARTSAWLGYEPATESAISDTESRLGCELPPSLKTFYLVSNGWIALGHAVYDVLPVEQLGWLVDRDPDLHKLVTDTEQTPGPFKRDPDDARLIEYRYEQGTRVMRSLVLNATGDASTWLLDPETKTTDGEWAGGRWSSWNPAMTWSADSFEKLMLAECETFILIRDG